MKSFGSKISLPPYNSTAPDAWPQRARFARPALDSNRKAGKVTVQADELIGRWQVFADLDLVKRAELLTLFKPRSAVPGDRLIRKGDAANEVFFISSGEVEVSVSGRKITLSAGDLFGEMGLLSEAPRNADVTAIDYCQLLTLDRKDFQSFVMRHPELKEKINAIASTREAMNRRESAGADLPVRRVGQT